jgi:hypothetical protein
VLGVALAQELACFRRELVREEQREHLFFGLRQTEPHPRPRDRDRDAECLCGLEPSSEVLVARLAAQRGDGGRDPGVDEFVVVDEWLEHAAVSARRVPGC